MSSTSSEPKEHTNASRIEDKSSNQRNEREVLNSLKSGHSKVMSLLARRKNDLKKVGDMIKAKRPEGEWIGAASHFLLLPRRIFLARILV